MTGGPKENEAPAVEEMKTWVPVGRRNPMICDVMRYLSPSRPQVARRSRRFVPGLGNSTLEMRLAPSGGGYPDATITITSEDQGGGGTTVTSTDPNDNQDSLTP